MPIAALDSLGLAVDMLHLPSVSLAIPLPSLSTYLQISLPVLPALLLPASDTLQVCRLFRSTLYSLSALLHRPMPLLQGFSLPAAQTVRVCRDLLNNLFVCRSTQQLSGLVLSRSASAGQRQSYQGLPQCCGAVCD